MNSIAGVAYNALCRPTIKKKDGLVSGITAPVELKRLAVPFILLQVTLVQSSHSGL